MREGTKAVFMIGDYSYNVGYFKITDCDDEYFCGFLELTLDDTVFPDVDVGESYNARLYVNGDAVWYFPWLWFDKPDHLPKMKASTNGAIFCPFGLSAGEEAKYEAINSFLSVEPDKSLPTSMWKQMLLVCADWLLERSIPQNKDFTMFANEVNGEIEPLENKDEGYDTEDEEN